MKTNAKVLISLVVLGLCVMGCACASEEIPPFMKDAFRAVDKNADRVISPEEAKVIGGPLHVTLERFKAADTNGDHRLNLAECHAAKLWAPPPSGSVVVPPVVGSTVVVPPPAGRAIVGPHGPNTPIARDIREDARDRREDIADRREDIRDRQEDRIDALHDGGRADRLEDIRDRQEDIRDRNEDRRDRAEDRHDRNHGAPPRRHR